MESTCDAASDEAVRRFAIADVQNADSAAGEELVDALRGHGFAVLTLEHHDAEKVARTLSTVGSLLTPLHRCEPRVRQSARVSVSSQPRRVMMSLHSDADCESSSSDDDDDDEALACNCTTDGETTTQLASVASAAAEAYPVLLSASRATTGALAAASPAALEAALLNDGKFDGFWYPSDGGAHDGGSFEDKACPCASHTDPGIVTVIAEASGGLEVRDASDGLWRRLTLQPHELAVLTGQQLAILTGGVLAACTHRVAPMATPRTSFVLEVAQRRAHDMAHDRAPLDPRSRIAHQLWDPRGGFTR